MPRTGAIVTQPRAGWVEPRRLAVRSIEATPDASPIGSGTLIEGGELRAGERVVGPFRVESEFQVGGDVGAVSLSIQNHSKRPQQLAAVIAGFAWVRGERGALRFLRHGWQSWSFTGARDLDRAGESKFPSGPWLRGMHHAVGDTPADRQGWCESDLVSVAGASPSGPACLVGVLEQGRSFGVVYLREQGDQLLIEVELRVDAVLAPGETRALEAIRISLGIEATRLLEEYAEAHGRTASARTAHPFVSGWCSWYHFFHDVTEDDVLRNLDALVDARDALPVEVVQIDDGYQRAIGDWLETNSKFPLGLSGLADRIRAAGFIAGLWTAPFCVVPESRIYQDHPDWLLQNQGEPFRGLLHPNWTAAGSVYVLDCSRAEVAAHLEQIFRDLASLGFSYFKLDFLYTAAMECVGSDPRVGRAERLRRGLDAVRSGAGDEAFLLGCGCPLGAAVGVVDGMRIGPDVAPSWAADPRHVIPGLEETLPATRSAIRSTYARCWMHRRLWQNDPDCLMARSQQTGLNGSERASLAAAIAVTGGSVFFSDDVPALSQEDRRLVGETVAAARAVDEMGIPGLAGLPDPLSREIAGEVLATGPEANYVALINATDEPKARRFDVPGASVPRRVQRLLATNGSLGWDRPVQLDAHASVMVRAIREFSLAVFCDFDGTFSVQDVGATLAIRHAGERRPAVWSRFERGELQAWEYNLQILGGLELPRWEVDAFLETVELDPGARQLVDWCDRRNVPFRILSDGFDYNLNHLQVIHGIRFAYAANHLRFDSGVWRIRAGAPDPNCSCGTGTCKRGRIEALRRLAPGVTIVHIGNGRVSDTCGALAADVAFAKDSLATELDRLGEPYEHYATLSDVIDPLEKLL